MGLTFFISTTMSFTNINVGVNARSAVLSARYRNVGSNRSALESRYAQADIHCHACERKLLFSKPLQFPINNSSNSTELTIVHAFRLKNCEHQNGPSNRSHVFPRQGSRRACSSRSYVGEIEFEDKRLRVKQWKRAKLPVHFPFSHFLPYLWTSMSTPSPKRCCATLRFATWVLWSEILIDSPPLALKTARNGMALHYPTRPTTMCQTIPRIYPSWCIETGNTSSDKYSKGESKVEGK